MFVAWLVLGLKEDFPMTAGPAAARPSLSDHLPVITGWDFLKQKARALHSVTRTVRPLFLYEISGVIFLPLLK